MLQNFKQLKVHLARLYLTQRLVKCAKFVQVELYYLIKDGDGNYFKLKILSMKNDKGERGYPAFEYELLK